MPKPSCESCPKCGCYGPTYTYAPADRYFRTPEQLELTCGRCGYEWVKSCLDKNKKRKKQ